MCINKIFSQKAIYTRDFIQTRKLHIQTSVARLIFFVNSWENFEMLIDNRKIFTPHQNETKPKEKYPPECQTKE